MKTICEESRKKDSYDDIMNVINESKRERETHTYTRRKKGYPGKDHFMSLLRVS